MTTSSSRADARTTIMLSWGFLFSLGLLLANDFLLKGLYGNWVTGKLSDLAGLFAFPLVLTACFPKRARAIHLGTAVGFILFKSPVASPLIAWWNSIGFITMGRVADYTDFIALPMVGASYLYARRLITIDPLISHTFWRRLATNLGLFASFFAFAATSRVDKSTPIKITTRFEYCLKDVTGVLPKLHLKKHEGAARLTWFKKDRLQLEVTSKIWKNIWSSKYKDISRTMSVQLVQHCTGSGCVTIPRFVCREMKARKQCDSVHHKAAQRVQEELNRFFVLLHRELKLSGARRHPRTCPAP